MTIRVILSLLLLIHRLFINVCEVGRLKHDSPSPLHLHVHALAEFRERASLRLDHLFDPLFDPRLLGAFPMHGPQVSNDIRTYGTSQRSVFISSDGLCARGGGRTHASRLSFRRAQKSAPFLCGNLQTKLGGWCTSKCRRVSSLVTKPAKSRSRDAWQVASAHQ